MKCKNCKRLAVDVCDRCQKPLCTSCKNESDYCAECDAELPDAEDDDDDDGDDVDDIDDFDGDDDDDDDDDDDSTGSK
jgi:hypothetical protein